MKEKRMNSIKKEKGNNEGKVGEAGSVRLVEGFQVRMTLYTYTLHCLELSLYKLN